MRQMQPVEFLYLDQQNREVMAGGLEIGIGRFHTFEFFGKSASRMRKSAARGAGRQIATACVIVRRRPCCVCYVSIHIDARLPAQADLDPRFRIVEQQAKRRATADRVHLW